MDKALVFGTKDCGFKSHQELGFFTRRELFANTTYMETLEKFGDLKFCTYAQIIQRHGSGSDIGKINIFVYTHFNFIKTTA